MPWREEANRWTDTGVVLEMHLLPLGNSDQLGARELRELPRRLARASRDNALFDETESVALATTERGAAAQLDVGARRMAGLRVTPQRTISVWESLPTQFGGVVYDESDIAARLARDVAHAAVTLLAGSHRLVPGLR